MERGLTAAASELGPVVPGVFNIKHTCLIGTMASLVRPTLLRNAHLLQVRKYSAACQTRTGKVQQSGPVTKAQLVKFPVSSYMQEDQT
ncbi:hypothetical protein BaRGS_00029349 [Batillaria attramentaria]|uniref:Uncharacterized protein n=1 Tax=Batillaria attramentaria TaxID=370345 RepID=A0ABD0JXK6_9CAEN